MFSCSSQPSSDIPKRSVVSTPKKAHSSSGQQVVPASHPPALYCPASSPPQPAQPNFDRVNSQRSVPKQLCSDTLKHYKGQAFSRTTTICQSVRLRIAQCFSSGSCSEVTTYCSSERPGSRTSGSWASHGATATECSCSELSEDRRSNSMEMRKEERRQSK
jgi:hypothetical protein